MTAPRQLVDLDNRDPNDMNECVKVSFEDVLAEPDGARSFDIVWDCSYKCFECSKNCSYKFASALCGCCIAFYWGCEFGCLAFNCIWCFSPCLRQYSIVMGNLQKYCGITINCCCAPFFEVCGLFFSRIHVFNKNIP